MGFKNVFDEYERKARIYPAVIFLLPLIIEIYVLIPQLVKVEGIAGGVIMYLSLSLFFASIIRKRGKDKQQKLWENLGAKPTTILLRYSNNAISKETKRRYHKKITQLISNFSLPTENEEKDNPEKADERYDSAIEYLIEHTRDKIKYSLVYKENIAYGFVRNMNCPPFSVQKVKQPI